MICTAPRRTPARVVALAGLLALFATMSFAAWLLVVREDRPAEVDFVSLAVADELAGSSPADLYDFARQLELQRQASGDPHSAPRPFVNPPHVALIARVLVPGEPLSTDGDPHPLAAGYVRLALVNLVVLGALVAVVWRLASPLDRGRRAVVAIGMVGAFPVAAALAEGSVSLWAGLGVALVVLGLHEERAWLGGAGLALATVKPHLALVALVVLVGRRQLGVLARAAALGATMVAISVATLGPLPWLRYPGALLRLGGDAAPERRMALRWWNLLTPLRVLLGPAAEPQMARAGTVIALVGLTAVGLLASRHPGSLAAAVLLVAGTLSLPHANGHDLAWVPAAFALVWADERWQLRPRYQRAVLLSMAVIWARLSWVTWPERSFLIPVGVLVAFVLLAWPGRDTNPSPQPTRRGMRDAQTAVG